MARGSRAGKRARGASRRRGKATSKARPAARIPRPSTAVRGAAPRAQPTTVASLGGPAGIVAAEPAADLPGYCLAHLTRETSPSGLYTSYARYYDLYPIEIPRPAAGKTTATIECGTCGKGLACTVSSLARMRRRKLAARLALAVTGAGCCAGLVTAILRFASLRSPYFLYGLVAPMMVTTVALVIVRLNLGETGPASGVKLRRGGLHEIRLPGDTVAVVHPRGVQGA